jgi:hypothetical protein
LNAFVEDDDGISEVKVKISETEPNWSEVKNYLFHLEDLK